MSRGAWVPADGGGAEVDGDVDMEEVEEAAPAPQPAPKAELEEDAVTRERTVGSGAFAAMLASSF